MMDLIQDSTAPKKEIIGSYKKGGFAKRKK
jgi:hypothetical protein